MAGVAGVPAARLLAVGEQLCHLIGSRSALLQHAPADGVARAVGGAAHAIWRFASAANMPFSFMSSS